MQISRREAIVRTFGAGAGIALVGYASAEPVTLAVVAGFVALELLKGAIGYAGGKLLASALGDPSITDVQVWIRTAVAELEAFVSAELKRQLDAKVLEQLQANLAAVNTHLYQYSHLSDDGKKKNKYLLEASDVATASLLPLAQNYDQALFIATTGIALRLYTIFALYELDREPGHIVSFRPMIETFTKSAQGARDRIADKMDPKNYVTGSCVLVEHRPGSNWLFSACQVTENAKVVHKFSTDKGPLVAQAELKKQIDRRSEPYVKRRNDFLAVINESISKTSYCYNKMCCVSGQAQACISDSQTDSVPPSSLDGKHRVIRMPGAIVRTL